MRCLRLWVARTIATTALVVSGAGTAFSGAFPQPAGKGQVIATFTADTSSVIFDAAGKAFGLSNWRKLEISAYAEYGVTDRLTAVFQPSLEQVRTVGPPAGAYDGLGVTSLGARYVAFEWGESVVSAQASLRLPGATNAGNPALAGNTGAGVDLRLLYGRNFELFSRKFYLDMALAWRRRGAGMPDEVHVDNTLGLRINETWSVIAQMFSTFAQANARAPAMQAHKMQASAVYDVNAAWSVQAGAFLTLSGVNVRRERGLVAAVWYRF